MSKNSYISKGAGESGKSTVLKQMRLIHASGFKSSEREGFRIVVFFNIFTTIQTLLEAIEILNLEFDDPVLSVHICIIIYDLNHAIMTAMMIGIYQYVY